MQRVFSGVQPTGIAHLGKDDEIAVGAWRIGNLGFQFVEFRLPPVNLIVGGIKLRSPIVQLAGGFTAFG